MSLSSSDVRTFVAGTVAWCMTGEQAELVAPIRSACSGVPHDAAAAYATLAARTGGLLDAIERQRLALPAAWRDAVLRFAERMRRLRVLAETVQDEPLEAAVVQAFELTQPAAQRPPARGTRAEERGQIALAQSLEREPPDRVFPRQKHFSASALNAYAECPRKWFYRYACAAIEDPGSSAASYGTAFHLALEDFHGEFARPQAQDEASMRERIREYVRWAFERNRDGFETEVEFRLQRRRAQRTAQRYVDWVLQQARRAPFEVVGRETPANLDLGGHSFVGYIDRLDRDESSGAIGIVDYKTGSIAATPGEYREKIRSFREFQLPYYYWARRAENETVAHLALIPLRDARIDVAPVVLEVGRTISPGELERARERMIELANELASGPARGFEVARDPSACTYCAYATACADKPAPEPERFAR